MKMRRLIFKPTLAILLISCLSQAWADDYISPTFDCDVADERAERIICSFEDLSVLDQDLMKKIRAGKMNPLASNEANTKWLKNVRNRCVTADCLRRAYRERIEELDGTAESLRPASAATTTFSVPGSDTENTKIAEPEVPRLGPGSRLRDTSPPDASDTTAMTVQASSPEQIEAKATGESFITKLVGNLFLIFVYAVFGLYGLFKIIAMWNGDDTTVQSSSRQASKRPTDKLKASLGKKPRGQLYRKDKKVCATCQHWNGNREPNSFGNQVTAVVEKALCRASIMTRHPKTNFPRGASRRETLPSHDGASCDLYETWL